MAKTVDDLKAVAKDLRGVIKRTGTSVQELKALVSDTASTRSSNDKSIDFGEAIANVVLSYRHLEDARMRLGKLIQALDGGVSKYDRPEPPAQQQQQS